MNYDVGGLAQHIRSIVPNFHAPGSIGGADNFAEVAAHFGGVGIDGTNNFNGEFFSHQLSDGSADGTDAILNGANFLFQFVGLWTAVARRAFLMKTKPLR